jgi:hypothetical protein
MSASCASSAPDGMEVSASMASARTSTSTSIACAVKRPGVLGGGGEGGGGDGGGGVGGGDGGGGAGSSAQTHPVWPLVDCSSPSMQLVGLVVRVL